MQLMMQKMEFRSKENELIVNKYDKKIQQYNLQIVLQRTSMRNGGDAKVTIVTSSGSLSNTFWEIYIVKWFIVF